MKYNNHLNYRDRRKLLIKLRIVYAIFGLLVIAGAAVFYLRYVKEDIINDKAVSGETKSIVAPTITTFKSPFFQFQASNDWAEVPKESTPNKFVYRSFNETLVEHEMIIYVNQVPDAMNFKSTRVLPVDIVHSSGQTSRFSAGVVSESCGPALKKDVIPLDVQTVNFKGVNFVCYGRINEYNVVIGQRNGGTNMTMTRADNTTAVYTIQYKDLRAINNSAEIDQIASSFQSI